MNSRIKDIKNLKFGRLRVLQLSHTHKRQAFWECECDCGGKCIIPGNKLRSGRTKSCGCITKTRNGLYKTKVYRSWQAMMARCYNLNNNRYKIYGARGIEVDSEWHNFNVFLKDMGHPNINQTLDRIDVNKNYSKDNCRWATLQEQSHNKRTNFRIKAFGKEQTLTQWAQEYNMNWATLRKRIKDLKWPIEKALKTKVQKQRRNTDQKQLKKLKKCSKSLKKVTSNQEVAHA